MPIRTLDQLIADLDTRQREPARSRNRVVALYAGISETVSFTSEAILTSNPGPTPFLWANVPATTSSPGSSARSATTNMCEWG